MAPLNKNEAEIIKTVGRRAPWIIKQIDYFRPFVPVTPPRRFISGETHLFLGRQYRLKVVPGNINVIKVYRGQLWMHTLSTEPETLKKQLNEWYKQKAIIVFHEMLQEILYKFRHYQLAIPMLTIRTMTKRWGSCTPSGRIMLNLELIKAPKGCIAYVIMHELCHLVHHHHGKPFRDLLDRMMPDCWKWKKRLELSLI
jgi:predicted metal-dependent hydrolase